MLIYELEVIFKMLYLFKINHVFLFISGAEIVFVFFIVLLVFGADKIPSIAKTLAKAMTQVRRATNDIKNEIQNSVDVESPTKKITQDFKEEVDKVKKDFDDLGDSIKREL